MIGNTVASKLHPHTDTKPVSCFHLISINPTVSTDTIKHVTRSFRFMVFVDRIKGTDNAMWTDNVLAHLERYPSLFRPCKGTIVRNGDSRAYLQSSEFKIPANNEFEGFQGGCVFLFRRWHHFWETVKSLASSAAGGGWRCGKMQQQPLPDTRETESCYWNDVTTKRSFFSLRCFLPVSSGVKKGHAKRRSATARVKSYPCKIPKEDPLLQCSNEEEVGLRLAFAWRIQMLMDLHTQRSCSKETEGIIRKLMSLMGQTE